MFFTNGGIQGKTSCTMHARLSMSRVWGASFPFPYLLRIPMSGNRIWNDAVSLFLVTIDCNFEVASSARYLRPRPRFDRRCSWRDWVDASPRRKFERLRGQKRDKKTPACS